MMEKGDTEKDVVETVVTNKSQSLHFVKHRLNTFKDWPFVSNCQCTPELMASAGFIHCPTENEPDLVQCFICYKELDGWEPDDDPWKEHRSHAPYCAFVKLGKGNEDELTARDFIKLETVRIKNMIKKLSEKREKELHEHGALTKQELEKLGA